MVLAVVGAGIAVHIGRSLRHGQRRSRRRTRRGRRLNYQRLWDEIMTRPRLKRLEHRSRDR